MQHRILSGCCIGIALFGSASANENATTTQHWSLNAALQRVLQAAPELEVSRAELAARRGSYREAVAWPNPTLAIRADNRLGKEDGLGGTDITQLELRQPLPLSRLTHQGAVADGGIEMVKAKQQLERLRLERDTARSFHRLQLAQSRLQLANEHLRLAENTLARRDRLVRYLPPADRARLMVLHEQIQQGLLAAQSEEERARIEFRARLGLPPTASFDVAALASPPVPPSLDALLAALDHHPQLLAANRETQMAQASIAVAESQRYSDPELIFYRERDYLNNARSDVTGVGVSMQIPLWNTNRGPVDRAQAEHIAAQTRGSLLMRDAQSSLRQTYLLLAKLQEQSTRLQTELLTPATQAFTLTRRSFEIGEVSVLTFVDALNTHIEAGYRYCEVLWQSHEALADVYLSAGLSLLETDKEQP